jgi:hypothetical protein
LGASKEEVMKTQSIRRSIHTLAAFVIAANLSLAVNAAEVQTHNPYTVLGTQIRTNLLPAESSSAYAAMEVSEGVGPTLFQEIVPCRFVSTLDPDLYPLQWGGQPFQVSESRIYHPKGMLVDGLFVNPCSELIPQEAVALSVRIMSHRPDGNGSVYLAPAEQQNFGIPALEFKKDNDTLKEANVVLHHDAFVVTTVDQATELTIDIIGYYIKDDYDRGAKGDTGAMGPQGAQGPRGEQGEQGERGERGDRGYDGAVGAQGAKGADGAMGPQGERGLQGERGEVGPAGAQGAKGEVGATGVQGPKGNDGAQGTQGLQGTQGERGLQGLKGDKGENGSKGDKGDAGAKGDRGENGAKGDKGDKGATGDKGLQGERGYQGERGFTGATGAQGPMGPQGPQGVPGVSMTVGTLTFPPGGNVTITNENVKSNSVIVLLYIEVSNGNALGVASQKNGSFVASGSPNKPFKYVIFNMN